MGGKPIMTIAIMAGRLIPCHDIAREVTGGVLPAVRPGIALAGGRTLY